MTNVALQRGSQSLCDEADEFANSSECGADFRRVGHPRVTLTRNTDISRLKIVSNLRLLEMGIGFVLEFISGV